MGRFEAGKRTALNNLAASESVGDVDGGLEAILGLINGLGGFYTTSSCGGRVALMQDLGGKGVDRFIVKWHRKVAVEEVKAALKPCGGVVWFRYECPILHVMARDPGSAGSLLRIGRESGFKRTGIQSLKDGRILLEVLSTERIDAPVMAGGRMLVSEDYLGFLVQQANLKYDAGRLKLKRLEENIRAFF